MTFEYIHKLYTENKLFINLERFKIVNQIQKYYPQATYHNENLHENHEMIIINLKK